MSELRQRVNKTTSGENNKADDKENATSEVNNKEDKENKENNKEDDNPMFYTHITSEENNKKDNKEHESIPEFKFQSEALPSDESLAMKIYSRVLVFISLFVVVYYSLKEEKVITFARQMDTLPGKGEIVQCSSEYLNMLDNYEGCGPKECKRFITDQVISREEAEEILQIFKRVQSESESPGRIPVTELYKGSLPQNGKANVFTESDFNTYNAIKEKVKQSMVHHFGPDPSKIYLSEETYFSAITSETAPTAKILNEYQESIGDKDSKKGVHYTTILYLGDYKKDFKGGRFVFVDYKVNKTVEPKKGRINMFTSGAENYNYVEKVTHGTRYAITFSFSCDKNNAVYENNIKFSIIY